MKKILKKLINKILKRGYEEPRKEGVEKYVGLTMQEFHEIRMKEIEERISSIKNDDELIIMED